MSQTPPTPLKPTLDRLADLTKRILDVKKSELPKTKKKRRH